MSELIIDGCNVAECCCFEENMCLWSKRYYENPRSPKCEEVKDCYFKQLQRAKAENEKLKERLENKEKAYNHLCDANSRKKEQIKNLNYMLFEEKEMTTKEFKLKYRLANKERKFIQYKEITNKKLNNYKQTLEDIREFINNSCKGCTSECDCVIDDDEYCPNYTLKEKINKILNNK